MAKARVAVLISGSGTNMAALLYAAKHADCPYEVVLVASNNPAAAGLKLAEAEGVPTFAHPHIGLTREAHDGSMHGAIVASKADTVALAGYMRILSDGFVERWAGRLLNIHPSLLPKYKGLDTHARAIAAGDSAAGVSVHLVTPDLDAGAVLGQIAVTIRLGETADSLAERVRFAEHQLYPRVLGDYVARERDPAWLLARVRTLALALPETHERESHGSPGWRAGSEKSGKFFAYFSDQHHGTPHVSLLVKCGSMDELEDLIEAQPHAYHKPAYYGASSWIGVILNRPGVDWDEVSEWLARSWRQVAPRSAARLIDVADQF